MFKQWNTFMDACFSPVDREKLESAFGAFFVEMRSVIGKTVYIYGPPGSGKTSFGQIVTKMLNGSYYKDIFRMYDDLDPKFIMPGPETFTLVLTNKDPTNHMLESDNYIIIHSQKGNLSPEEYERCMYAIRVGWVIAREMCIATYLSEVYDRQYNAYRNLIKNGCCTSL